MGWKMGFEPTVSSATNWRVNQLRYIHHRSRALRMSTFNIITNFPPICQGVFENFFTFSKLHIFIPHLAYFYAFSNKKRP